MSVLDRAALQASPLADLHAIASELSIDGYRRLRRPDLIDAILARQDAADSAAGDVVPADTAAADTQGDAAPARRRRGRRGGRRGSGGEPAAGQEPTTESQAEQDQEPVAPAAPVEPAVEEDELVEGVVELLPNGSGFLRVNPPEPSDGDVYISAAQVKRCELVSGDRIAGPRRPPRRSERFASLLRVDTINDQPAAELTPSPRFDELPAAFPTERLRLGDDPTLRAIDVQAPIGRGSRVTIVGPAGAGKSDTLRRLGLALAGDPDLQISLVLAGVRPEELGEWSDGSLAPAAALSFAASADAQSHAVELVVDQARRIAVRGANAVVLIDTLDGLHQHTARKALAAARNIIDGGSVTVIATATQPLGGETTVIALDRALTPAEIFPALDQVATHTLHADRLQ